MNQPKSLLRAASVILMFVVTACSMGAPVPTATPVPTSTPVPPTATMTPSPTLTPTPVPMLSVNAAVDCYAGPSEQYDKVASLEAGTEIQVVGQSEDGTFWIVATESGIECWLAKESATVTVGEVSVLPQIIPPATPTLGPPAAPSDLAWVNECNVYFDRNRYNLMPSFYMTWRDNSDNEDGFIIYRDGSEIKRLPSDTTKYGDDAYIRYFNINKYVGPRIRYDVAAFNAVGVSDIVTIIERIYCP